MKRITNKTLLFFFMIASLCCLLFLSASAAQEITSGDFVFVVDADNATLKEYKGSDADVKIPSKVGTAKVTAIGNEAFWANRTMKSVSIPTTVKSIGIAAFNECTSLTKVNIPYSVTSIGDAAFWYCTGLKQVFIPKNTTAIGDNVFVGCHGELTVYVVKGSYGEKRISSLKNINMAYRYITSLKLSSTSSKVALGSSITLTHTVTPEKVYSSAVTYTSSNTAVATVSSKGKITAVGTGTATITCTAKDGSKLSATCKITVVPGKVTKVTAVNPTYDGFTLTWEKTDGATGYRVYKYNSATKKYEGYKNVSGNSLKITGLKVGAYEYYKVYAYAKVGGSVYYAAASSACKAYTARPGKVTAITAKPAHSYINLSWSAADFATGYKLYFYNSETSKYTYIGSTTKTAYKVSGLTPDTGYTFMVRAYMKYNGTTVNASYSPLKAAYTRPDYVSGFSVRENSVYTTRLTLEWELLPGAAGYAISVDDGTGSYETIATIKDSAVNCFTVEGLKPGTEYLFKIRAFSDNSGGTLYGYVSKIPLSVATNNRPASGAEGFAGFVEAYNSVLSSDGSLAIISLYETTAFEGVDSELYEGVITSTEMSGTVYSYLSGGKDKNGLTAAEILHGSELGFVSSDAQVTYFDEDGNGYRIDFTLGGDRASELFSFGEWERVADENDGFILNEEIYGDAQVTAKVQNGLIDDITVTVPVTVCFTLDGQEYSFTQVYTATYLFIR